MPINSAVTPITTQNVGIASSNMTAQMQAALEAQNAERNRQLAAQEGAANRASQSADYAQLNKNRLQVTEMELAVREREAQKDRDATRIAAEKSQRLTLQIEMLNAQAAKETAEARKKTLDQRNAKMQEKRELNAKIAAAGITARALERGDQQGAIKAVTELMPYHEAVKVAQDRGVEAGATGAARFMGRAIASPEGQMEYDPEGGFGYNTKSKGGLVKKETREFRTEVFGLTVSPLWWSWGGVDKLQEDLNKVGEDATSLLDTRPDVYQNASRELATAIAQDISPPGKEGVVTDGVAAIISAISGVGSSADPNLTKTMVSTVESTLNSLKEQGTDPSMVMYGISSAIGNLKGQATDKGPLADADFYYATQKDKDTESTVRAALAPWVRRLSKNMHSLDSLSGRVMPDEEELRYTIETLASSLQEGDISDETIATIPPQFREKLLPYIEAGLKRQEEKLKAIEAVRLAEEEKSDIEEFLVGGELDVASDAEVSIADKQIEALQKMLEEVGG